MTRLLLALVVALAGAAPAIAQDKPLARIAFGSCADQDKPCPIWGSIGKLQPDLLVLLGDTMYADLDKSKKVDPNRIRETYGKVDAEAEFAKLKKTVPILATWDDHDFGKNDGDARFPFKDESQQIFLDFFGVPKDSPRRTRKGVYHAQVFGPEGKRVQVIMLDGRYHRSTITTKFNPRLRVTESQPNTDPAATFLGEEQWTWFEEQLKVPAELRLIGTGIQVLSEEHPFEKWSLIPHERERLFKLLRDTKANGVVFLSGDRHLAELSMSQEAISYPLYDITASGFNQANKAWRAPEKNRHRVAAMPYGNNFGFITIDWTSETSPRVTLQLRDEEGEIVVRHAIRLGMLTPNENVAAKPKESKPSVEVKRPEGVLSPAEALKGKVGDEVTLQFEVKGGRLTADKRRLFLNSEADFRDEKNFTVVMNAKSREGTWKDATGDTFKGKTVRIKGKLSKFQNQIQIEVDDEKQVEVVK
ncbi:MAG: alkaline phosphatase family protein [Planctomycetia bacterium]|nr:alkaline phosphatase family protein [Planctomycetia bacterium]